MKRNNESNKFPYDFVEVEKRWRKAWDAIDLYRTGSDPDKPYAYILDFFPYPSGAGLSVGHCRNYIPTCVSARFQRMNGYNVLHPMGWDAFGLPAENYAIKHDIHPRESSAQFCATYRRQMQLIACSYDWSREFSSTDPAFYRWTQWFFLLLHRRGLAYRAKSSQWWCRVCQTILANEQVQNGRCWRGHDGVTRKELEQWHFRITDYAERLLADLDTIDWPEAIKTMQRNWIGRSEGLEIAFALTPQGCNDAGEESAISVFTTRPDTLYGATFLVLAPEHPQAASVATPERKEDVGAYLVRSKRLSERDRSAGADDRSGVFSGRFATHPLTGERLPVWIANYVLPGYGTGAIMAVPAHDERDYTFAAAHDLPVVTVIEAPDDEGGAVHTGHGILVNSGRYSGVTSEEGAKQIADNLVGRGLAERQVHYKMRDWLISRQRYWGAPIPMVHCEKCGAVPVPESELPVLLPDTPDFAPAGDGRSPLARLTDWVNTECPGCGGPAQRETDTMDGFACSSWYYLRFTSPDYEDGPFDPEAMRRWMPVDTYVGGAEHAVMHLLYARFWTKVMYDAGLVDFVEPFSTLLNQGVMHSAVDGQRMSKSKGNVVTPDEVVAAHGTDALRLYILFLGPFDGDAIWDDRGIKGITRFLDRYWRLATRPVVYAGQAVPFDPAFEGRRHQTIKHVTADIGRYRFNTAIATLMSYLNYLAEAQDQTVDPAQWHAALKTFTLLLSPMAPFMTEELWQHVLSQRESVHRQSWPDYDDQKTAEKQVAIVVQVNGRVRDRLDIEAGADDEHLRAVALASPRIQRYLAGKTPQQVFVVPDRLVNIVI